MKFSHFSFSITIIFYTETGQVTSTGLDNCYEMGNGVIPTTDIGWAVPPPGEKPDFEPFAGMDKRRVEKQKSEVAFNVTSLPNELIEALRYFECATPQKQAFNWGAVSILTKILDHLKESHPGVFRVLKILG